MPAIQLSALLALLAFTALVDAQTTAGPDCQILAQNFTIDEFRFGSYSTKQYPRAVIHPDPVSLTTYIQVQSVYDAVMKVLKAKVSEYSNTVNCKKISSFPDMVFVINGQELHIAAKDYVTTYPSINLCQTMISNISSVPNFDFAIPQLYQQKVCSFLQSN